MTFDPIVTYETAAVGGAGAQIVQVDAPEGTGKGHLLMAVVGWRGQLTISASDDWDAELHQESASSGPTLAAYRRVRQAGDPDTFTFTSNATSRVVAAVMRLHPLGVWETSDIDTGASATPTAPALTAGGPDRGLLCAYCWANAEDDQGMPEPLTERVRVDSSGAAGGRVRLVIGDASVGAGDTGAKQITLTPANSRSWLGVSALINGQQGGTDLWEWLRHAEREGLL
jgi:hypothetical protein